LRISKNNSDNSNVLLVAQKAQLDIPTRPDSSGAGGTSWNDGNLNCHVCLFLVMWMFSACKKGWWGGEEERKAEKGEVMWEWGKVRVKMMDG
jgi:hypothetical protein